MDWINEEDLYLINESEKCTGKYTWGRNRGENNEQKSAIDMVLVNKKLFGLVGEMIIDEKQEVINFSDHNLITIKLNLKMSKANSFKGNKWERITYYKKDEKSIEELCEEIKQRWSKGVSLERLWETLQSAQDKILKKTARFRVGEKMGERVIEPEWITQEIRVGIAERKRLKRLERNSTGEQKTNCKREWEIQKTRIQILVRETKRKWEREMANKVRECKNRGKML